ncbi:MAG: NADPH-dependent F420 reductase, partial [Myxococcaceae bacterium]
MRGHERHAREGAMRIGIIGSGNMGATLGQHWARAGHQVFYSSRHPQTLKPLVTRTGENARAGKPEEAAAFGEVLFLGVPYGAMPELAAMLGPLAGGKVVLDAGNIIPNRDGALAAEVKATGKGSGAYTA